MSLRSWRMLFVALLLNVALVGSVFGAWRARKANELKRETTRRRLYDVANAVRKVLHDNAPHPHADGTGEDRTGMRTLLAWTSAWGATPAPFYTGTAHPVRSSLERETETLDGWERPIVYRCPGPVHTHGWDLYSYGQNGEDDHGEGDDILIGENVAGFGSGS